MNKMGMLQDLDPNTPALPISETRGEYPFGLTITTHATYYELLLMVREYTGPTGTPVCCTSLPVSSPLHCIYIVHMKRSCALQIHDLLTERGFLE